MTNLTKEQEVKLWAIKLATYDYYGAKFDIEAEHFAEAVAKLVDDMLKKHGYDPVVLVH